MKLTRLDVERIAEYLAVAASHMRQLVSDDALSRRTSRSAQDRLMAYAAEADTLRQKILT